MKAIWHAQRVKARRLGAKGQLTGGGVLLAVVWQSPQADAHQLLPEAVWTSAGVVVEVPAPDDAEVPAVLQRVLRQAATKWPDDGGPKTNTRPCSTRPCSRTLASVTRRRPAPASRDSPGTRSRSVD